MASQAVKPRLLFVGPMLGSNPGWVTTQGEILADLFASAGYTVKTTSSIPGRLGRLMDTVGSMVSWCNAYDLVILSVFSGPAFGMAELSSAVARFLNKPLIMVLRGGNLPDFAQQHNQWVQRVLARADGIIAPSEFLAEFVRQWSLEVEVIPNVVRLEDYPFRLRSRPGPKLLWMRTFHEIYHPEMAIEVLKEVRRSIPEASLTMAGQEKGLLDTVRDLAQSYGLNGAVRFAGFLDQAGKRKEFAAHDIFLNTNRVDNAPVSVLEAAAFGLPVIATRVGGIPYLLDDGQNGLLVEDGDVKGMAQAVLRLLQEADLGEKLSFNGRILAESCAWEQVQQGWEAAITKALVKKQV